MGQGEVKEAKSRYATKVDRGYVRCRECVISSRGGPGSDKVLGASRRSTVILGALLLYIISRGCTLWNSLCS